MSTSVWSLGSCRLDFSGQLSLSYFMHWGFPYNGFNACIGVKKRVWVLHGASGSALRFWVWFTSLFSSFFATTPLPSSSPVNNFDLKVHIMFLGFYFISMLFSGYWGVGLVYGRRVKMILSTSIRESSVCFCVAANFFLGGGHMAVLSRGEGERKSSERGRYPNRLSYGLL